MKKVSLGILIAILALTFSGVIVIAKAITPQEKGKANAPDLEKIEFIHYKKDFAKPEAAKAPKPPSCYKFLTPGKNPIRWYDTINYVINPNNPQGLSETFTGNAVSTSAETWDAKTSKELMNNTYTIDYTAVYGVQNYENTLVFGDYPTKGVIAVTTVWYNPALKAIVEFDVMFDTDWTWGDASNHKTPKVMDLQNIATHELGHGIGLNDVYEKACNAVTMYGYSDYGETNKGTLEEPDTIGLQTLYPNF